MSFNPTKSNQHLLLTLCCRYSEQKCTNELDQILKKSPKVAILLKGIQTLNKDALRRGITCRPCKGTTQEVHIKLNTTCQNVLEGH
jgi:hypothetical protein